MKIGLCMSVIGGGGGNDIIFNSLRRYLSIEHDITVFSNANTNTKLPAFGLFRQLQTINHADMHKQDLLIFLTGNIPKTKIPIIYYHQQMPASVFTKDNKPEKYKKGLWKLYYDVFILIARLKQGTSMFNDNIKHYCVSCYLQEQLDRLEINSTLLYPEVDNIGIPKFKPNGVITVCRISPEKKLIDNIKALSGLSYIICGNTTRFTEYYLRELKKHLTLNQMILDNISRQSIKIHLANSKVYFSSSKETLGLAVLEGIASGCIPVVVNNTANKETVPFDELRFNEGDYHKARDIVSDALKGNYDYLIPKLQAHIKRFKADNYKQLLESVELTCKE